MKIGIIGSGNVATVLGKIIQTKGHEIVQVLSRNIDNAKALAEKLNCDFGSIKNTSFKDADIYLLTVIDTALYHLDQEVQLGDKLVVHTAGSVSKNVLKNISTNYGVLYPLQSLTKEISGDALKIPLLIDGSSDEVTNYIRQFANSLSEKVVIAGDEDRMAYHVAAVLVNNFTNHLFTMADNFCDKEGIDFKELFPLIDTTIKKLKQNSPMKNQTGPAVREDIYTLGKHLQILSAYPDIKYLYLKLSESILKYHHKK